eukprot:gb/GECG01006004.1/.p1 GENE.gb/GECG01006004.1/~~gb/GECG01006004.1/.p1  ORF type:complete len:816 (+),score=53.17 gb/GECG01006004.1/:1-2448(+)
MNTSTSFTEQPGAPPQDDGFMSRIERQLQFLHDSHILDDQYDSFSSYGAFRSYGEAQTRENKAGTQALSKAFHGWKELYQLNVRLQGATEAFHENCAVYKARRAVHHWYHLSEYHRQLHAKGAHLNSWCIQKQRRHYLGLWIEANTARLYRNHLTRKHLTRNFEAWYLLTVAEAQGRRRIQTRALGTWYSAMVLRRGLRQIMRRKRYYNNHKKAFSKIRSLRKQVLTKQCFMRWTMFALSIRDAKTKLAATRMEITKSVVVRSWRFHVLTLKDRRWFMYQTFKTLFVLPFLRDHFVSWQTLIDVNKYRAKRLKRAVVHALCSQTFTLETTNEDLVVERLRWTRSKRAGYKARHGLRTWIQHWRALTYYCCRYRPFEHILVKLRASRLIHDWSKYASAKQKQKFLSLRISLQMGEKKKHRLFVAWYECLRSRLAAKALSISLRVYFLRAAFGIWFSETGASKVQSAVTKELEYLCMRRVFRGWRHALVELPKNFIRMSKLLQWWRAKRMLAKWHTQVHVSSRMCTAFFKVRDKRMDKNKREVIRWWRAYSDKQRSLRGIVTAAVERIAAVKVSFALRVWRYWSSALFAAKDRLSKLRHMCVLQRKRRIWQNWQYAAEEKENLSKAVRLHDHIVRLRANRVLRKCYQCWRLFAARQIHVEAQLRTGEVFFKKTRVSRILRCWRDFCELRRRMYECEQLVYQVSQSKRYQRTLRLWRAQKTAAERKQVLKERTSFISKKRAVWYWRRRAETTIRLAQKQNQARNYYQLILKNKYFHVMYTGCTTQKRLRVNFILYQDFLRREELSKVWRTWKTSVLNC